MTNTKERTQSSIEEECRRKIIEDISKEIDRRFLYMAYNELSKVWARGYQNNQLCFNASIGYDIHWKPYLPFTEPTPLPFL